MPSDRHRSMNDTWKVDELERKLKEERKKGREGDGREKSDRHKDRRDRDERRHRDDDGRRREHKSDRDERRREGRSREGEERRRERGDGEHRERRHKSDRDKEDRHGEDREERRRHKDDRHREDREERRRDKDREDRHKDRDREERRKDRDEKEERRRDRGERDERRKERDERKKDRDREERGDERKDKDERRRDRDDRRRDKDDDRRKEDRRREREDKGERRKDRDERRRDKDREERHERKREGDDEDRERRRRDREERHKDREERHRDDRRRDDDERRSKRREDDDSKRRTDKDRHKDDDDERRRRRRKEEKDKEEDEGHSREDEERERQKRREARRRQKEEEEERKRQEEEERKRREEEKAAENDGDDYGDYEDDFEDYDDDFEDDDDDNDNNDDDDDDQRSESSEPDNRFGSERKTEGEMDEVLRAMDEENERLMHQAKKSEQERTQRAPVRNKPAARSFIDFSGAQQRQVSTALASKTKKRYLELAKMIELDIASFDLFSMAPVEEYELYMRNMGRTDTKQVRVQTNDDCIERDIQTDDIDYSSKWTQHPPEDIKGSGGDQNSETGEQEADESRRGLRQIDSLRLTKFVTDAGQLIGALMEEDGDVSGSGSALSGMQKSQTLRLSEGCSRLAPNPLLSGRRVLRVEFSASQGHMFLTMLSACNEATPDIPLSMQGMLCVWSVHELHSPTKYLVCSSQPRCCCFSPHKATVVFAGLNDGSITLWDLRESSTMHQTVSLETETVVLRHPTYTTASSDECHNSPVVSVTPIVSLESSQSKDTSYEVDNRGLSFQIASLEDSSTVCFWTVAEVPNPDPAGSEFDLGLSPGGRLKVIRSSSLLLEGAGLTRVVRSKCLKLSPRDPNHLYVGTDSGRVLHVVRYGGKAPPASFRTDLEMPVDVSCVDFSPFGFPTFLAGCSDGSLRLYRSTLEMPVLLWPNATEGAPIVGVQWSTSRPAVFYVLDAASRLHIWDLTRSESSAVETEQIRQERIRSFTLSHDHAATGLGAAGSKPYLALCLESGVELHVLPPVLLTDRGDDIRILQDILKRGAV